jgi:hypothetical protein
MRFFIILLVLVAAGCSPLYIPTTRNVPLFREQGEFQASVIASTGAEVQTALAVTDNIAVMVNGSLLRQKISEPESYTRSHTFVEGGIGYYKANRRSRVEIFAGYGLGKRNQLLSILFL